ncbi:hypothetical protein BJ878DRAFT_565433 [Calycina marina]|uniref:Peptidase M43 pregnancy-associated plasma-A domain-containing protein n=1 Tax=Calycina marina TaxID=1763456 RepID=A0A9P7Z7T7_9HELO|nr:hypothetical protein BJ878DRAFT_565433 [Calycina marina]
MLFLKSILFGLPALVLATDIQRCATKSPGSQLKGLHVAQAKVDSQNRLNGKEALDNTFPKVSVNTYVHVIASSQVDDDTPQAQIVDQINVINRAYRRHGFTFLLRNITRSFGKDWSSIVPDTDSELKIKSALRQGTYADLNFYIGNIGDGFGGILGYSTFPDYVSRDIFDLDAVVIDPGTLPNGTISKYDLGATAVHEIGHWLGLFHTFQDPLGPIINFGDGCTADGDFVYDTPAESSPAWGCPEGRDTCTGNSLSREGKDPIHNFMDYSDDSCLNLFSAGQMARAHVLYQQLRLDSNNINRN